MKARMQNPAMLFPDALQAMFALKAAVDHGDVAATTRQLIHLRVSQINGCSVCVDMHARELQQAGESAERLLAVAAWRDAPYFTDAERAALALAEAVTRLSDRSDPVPDDIWNEAMLHYDEKQLAALFLSIGMINFWNRLNVPTRQVAGEWAKSKEAKKLVEEHAIAQ
jgi:AhpD family alkylhydroperoxidase